MTCGWLSFEEYADKCNLPAEEVQREAHEGKFGTVATHPKTGKDVIIWPPNMQSEPLSALPEPGRYIIETEHRAAVPLTLDLGDQESFDQVQETILSLAHSIGEPEDMAKRAGEMLNQSCLLLEWTIFEVFLRSTIEELIRRHPSKIASGGKGMKSSLDYEEILEMSRNFTSLESLRASLTEREIERMQAGGESVHGLINFLKSGFGFKRDPYEAWYVFNGERHTTHYTDLVELKEVRNALVHDGGRPPKLFFEEYPAVPRRDNAIVIDNEYYLKGGLILSAIAFVIARCIDRGMYDASN